MRIVNPRDDIAYPIAHLLGIDPNSVDFTNEHARKWFSFINTRVEEAWAFWPWPELEITEERAFRTIWNASKSFKRLSTTDPLRFNKPDQLFYIPTMSYFQVLATAPSDPPAGTLPTNTTYFAPLPVFDHYVDLDQGCRRAIGLPLNVYNGNPLASGVYARPLLFRPSERGIEVEETASGPTVFVNFRIRESKFSATAWNSSTAYNAGNTVYATDGNCYLAILANTNQNPTAGVYWALAPFPERLATFVKLAVASDAADDMQTSAKLLNQAYADLQRKADQLIGQGQVSYYKVGDRRRQIWLGLGLSGFWWSVSSPYASTAGVTTLTDACENTFGGATTPLPVSVGFEGNDTALINGQEYIDVVFATDKGTAAWNFIDLIVKNTVDVGPLLLSPATLTNKTSTGFRVYFNGAPDSGNYLLQWKVGIF